MAVVPETVVYDGTPYSGGSSAAIGPDNADDNANPPSRRWARATDLSPIPDASSGQFTITKAASRHAYYYRHTANFNPPQVIAGPGNAGFGNAAVLEVQVEFASMTSGDLVGSAGNQSAPFRIYLGDGVRRLTLGVINDTGSNFRVGLLQDQGGGVANEDTISNYQQGASFALAAGTTYTLRLTRASDGSGLAEILSGSTVLSTSGTLAHSSLPTTLAPINGNLLGTSGPGGGGGLALTQNSGPNVDAPFYGFGVVVDGAGTYVVHGASFELRDHNSAGSALLTDGGRSIEMVMRDNAADNGIAPSTGQLWKSPDVFAIDLVNSGFNNVDPWTPPPGSKLRVPSSSSDTLCEYSTNPGTVWDVDTPTGNMPAQIQVGNIVQMNVANYFYCRVRNIGLTSSVLDATSTVTFFKEALARLFVAHSTTFNMPNQWVPNELLPPNGSLGEPINDSAGTNTLGTMPLNQTNPPCDTVILGPFTLSAAMLASLGTAHLCCIGLVHGAFNQVNYSGGGTPTHYAFMDAPPIELFSTSAISFSSMISNDSNSVFRNLSIATAFTP